MTPRMGNRYTLISNERNQYIETVIVNAKTTRLLLIDDNRWIIIQFTQIYNKYLLRVLHNRQ